MVGLLLAALGLVFGSFGTVLITRMPRNESIAGRSQCSHCKKVLSPKELIPLMSFALQRGRCRGCNRHISWQYPLIEISTMLIFLAAGFLSSFAILSSLALAITLWSMLMIAVIDAKTQMIPDVLTVVMGLAALLYHLLIADFAWSGAALGFLFFGSQWIFSRGRWVGSGDILLAVALGILVGTWTNAIVMLMSAYIIGALLVSVLIGLGHMKRTQEIAFGPFLVAGALIAFLFSEQIMTVMVPVY